MIPDPAKLILMLNFIFPSQRVRSVMVRKVCGWSVLGRGSWSHFRDLAGLELSGQTRLDLNLRSSACLCSHGSGVKGVDHYISLSQGRSAKRDRTGSRAVLQSSRSTPNHVPPRCHNLPNSTASEGLVQTCWCAGIVQTTTMSDFTVCP